MEDEDGYKCLQLMHLKHWRDAASQYKQDRKGMDRDDRWRITLLLEGRENALTADIEGLGQKSAKEKDFEKAKEFFSELESQATPSKVKKPTMARNPRARN